MEDDMVGNEKKQYTTVTITAIVALIIGAGIGFFIGMGQSSVAPVQNNQATVSTIPIPSDIRSLTGTVESVSGNTFVLAVEPGIFGQNLSKRTIAITSNTKVFTQKEKDSNTLQKEFDEYTKLEKSNKDTTPPTPPSPFIQSSASMSDIVPGGQVT
ncbi:hypothetical protein MNBD_CPR01-55, partial [hydrothermal vent metagenome]